MEHPLKADRDGVVQEVLVAAGTQVKIRQLLVAPGIRKREEGEIMLSLKEKRIFITGARSWHQEKIALRCAREGANLVLAAKSSDLTPSCGTIHSVAAEVNAVGAGTSHTAGRSGETSRSPRPCTRQPLTLAV